MLEILRAADAMLKPIRSGTVKAQSKGIIRDIQSGGQPLVRSTFPSGLYIVFQISTIIKNVLFNLKLYYNYPVCETCCSE